MKDDPKDEQNSRSPISFDINKLYEYFKQQFEELMKLMNSNNLQPDQPIIWGYSTFIGPEGTPQIRHFGNFGVPDQKTHSDVDKTDLRFGFTPFYDIIDDDELNEITIIIELPGVSKEELELQATNDVIRLKSLNPRHNYQTEIPLNEEIDPQNVKASLNNGVLEIIAKKNKQNSSPGQKVEIED